MEGAGSCPASLCQDDSTLTGRTGIDRMLSLSDRIQRNDVLGGPPGSKIWSCLAVANSVSAGSASGSSLHRKLCWQLLKHRQENVRNHIMRLVRYDGQIIWRADGRADAEITNETTAGGRDGQHWAECRCDPVREIIEEEMLPCLSKVLSQEELRRWLLPLRNTVWICRCGSFYKHLWKEALFVVHRQRRALRGYLRYMYSRLLVAGEAERYATAQC